MKNEVFHFTVVAQLIDVLQGQYVVEHGSINNSECRELLLLGNSNSAQSTVSRLLAHLDFLEPYGASPKTRRYRLRKT